MAGQGIGDLIDIWIYNQKEESAKKKLETFDGRKGVKAAIIDGELIYYGNEPVIEVVVEETTGDKPKPPTRGYIKKSTFDELNVTTVNLPANFAGLEAEMMPPRLQYQLFRIVEVVENEDYVEVTARHVWYDNLKNYTLWEVPKENKDSDYTAAAVCRNIMTNALSDTASRVASDCKDTLKGENFDYKNKNLVEAFLDPENGVCAKFGLSLIRNNWDFYCLKNVGYNRGFVVENGKNLLGVERTESIENLVTRVAPIGKTKKGDIVWLDHNGLKYIDSQYISNYSCPHVEIYDTGLQIGKGGVTAQNIQAKLLEAGQKRFSDDHVDIPEVEMTIEFISLGDTEEYAQYRGLDKVYLYDILTIRDTVRGYSYTAQVVGVEHDILTGMLNSVTIGKLNNWDGTRKIATWQVPEVNGENIRLLSIQAGAFAPGAIGSDDLQEAIIQYAHFASATIDALNSETINAVTANIQEIIAGKITADSIDTQAITAINAKLGVAEIANAQIANADIGFAQIKALTAESLIAHDAVTDRYYIRKLAVDNAQMVYATVGELVVKASDNKYYRLDIDAQGQLSPTEVTLTQGEITAGITSDGRASIIETDLTVTDLSAANMKAITALIDKITAARIDVDELWARQAFINKLMVQDISSNTYIQSTIGNWSSGSTITQTINSLDSRISSLGYGTVYMQPEEPSHSELVPGDIWIQTQPSGTWSEVYDDYATWQTIYNDVSTWQTLGGVSIMWVCDGRKWQQQLNNLDSDTFQTEIEQNAYQISLLATRTTTAENNISSLSASLQIANDAISAEVARATTAEGQKYSIQSGITITANGIDISGSQYVKIASGGVFTVQTGNFGINSESTTHVLWAGASTAASAPFWVKKDGSISATSGSVGGFTLAANSLSSGSGTGYVNINSNTSNTYAMWAGAEASTSAPFRIKRDGTVYLTSLIAVGENGTETTVNLRTAGLWKLGYHTIKSYTTSSITLSNNETVNFIKASTLGVGTSGSGVIYPTISGTQASGASTATVAITANASGYAISNGTIILTGNILMNGTTVVRANDTISANISSDLQAQYDAGWVAGYNAAAGKFTVTGSSSGRVTFPTTTTQAGVENTSSYDITADVTNPAQNTYMGIAYINYIQRATRSRTFS